MDGKIEVIMRTEEAFGRAGQYSKGARELFYHLAAVQCRLNLGTEIFLWLYQTEGKRKKVENRDSRWNDNKLQTYRKPGRRFHWSFDKLSAHSKTTLGEEQPQTTPRKSRL